MDTFMHGLHGALITSIVTAEPSYLVYGALFGAMPDIVGYYGKFSIKGRKIVYNKNDWELYNFVHELSFANPLVYLPQSLAHILLDKPFHTKNCKWWLKPCRKWWLLAWLISLIMTGLRVC